ncbi:restriction endonuclease subunit S, partial [Dialister hominis]|uniref:restriction endonuclease subunit S n=1 Tax=Dialister hominis TaxID=2582419 RepID=UPI003AB67B60
QIAVPGIVEQKCIGDLLKVLDDKIQLNTKINKNLAEQIKTICTAWLSDYAPFGGILPNDWSEMSLSSIADFVNGYSYKGTELTESNIAMATIKNFDRKGGFKLDGYKEIIPSNKLKDTQHAELFDTLVAHTDLTQNAEVIGNAEPVMSKSGYDDIVFSMDLVKVVPKSKHISKFLIAAILQDKKFKAHCLGYVNGTTVLHLSKKALPEYQLYLPDDLSVLKPLDELVTALYQRISANIEEIIKLETLRDTLLPKLMSGELDVSNIDL